VRQTNLTAAELVDRLDTYNKEHSRSFYVNELGELARAGDRTAEAALVRFLDPEQSVLVRAAAYANLLMIMRPLPAATNTALREFADETANEGIVKWAEHLFGLGLPAA
jgi:hypothetical protein